MLTFVRYEYPEWINHWVEENADLYYDVELGLRKFKGKDALPPGDWIVVMSTADGGIQSLTDYDIERIIVRLRELQQERNRRNEENDGRRET